MINYHSLNLAASLLLYSYPGGIPETESKTRGRRGGLNEGRGQRQMMLINIQKGYGGSLYEASFISGDPCLTALLARTTLRPFSCYLWQVQCASKYLGHLIKLLQNGLRRHSPNMAIFGITFQNLVMYLIFSA